MSIWNHDLLLETAKAMDVIVGSNPHALDTLGQC